MIPYLKDRVFCTFRFDDKVQHVFRLLRGRRNDVSIRHRVRQAARIVHHLCQAENEEEGSLRPGSRLLIVHAGAAGISAALMAYQQGRLATILHHEDVGAPLLNCTTRDVDPWIYCWPEIGCEQTQVPATDAPQYADSSISEPLHWKKGAAAGIAADWSGQLETVIAEAAGTIKRKRVGEPLPRILPAPQVEDFEQRQAEVTRRIAALPEREKYGMILFTGIEPEDCQLPPAYSGPSYWQDDKFADWASGKYDTSALVSGRGDGALQDFLRLTCGGKPTREVCENIFEGLEAHPGFDSFVRQKVRAAIHRRETLFKWTEEDHSDNPYPRREGNTPVRLHGQVAGSLLANAAMASHVQDLARSADETFDVQERLSSPMHAEEAAGAKTEQEGSSPAFRLEDQRHDEIHSMYQALLLQLSGSDLWSAIRANIERKGVISPALQAGGERTVTLVYDHVGFANCYPLNHFLTLLIGWYAQNRPGGRQLIFPGHRTRMVWPAPAVAPAPPGEAAEHCHGGAKHQVRFQPNERVLDFIRGERLAETLEFNPVVIRHGLQKADPPL